MTTDTAHKPKKPKRKILRGLGWIVLLVICLKTVQWVYYGLRNWVDPTEVTLEETFYYYGELYAQTQTPRLGSLARMRYAWAMHKFPHLKYCLKLSGRRNLDIEKFNWRVIRNDAQLQVCLHHVATAIANPSPKPWQNGLNSKGLR